jgi:hypothetical protein
MTLIDILRDLIRSKAGDSPVAYSTESGEPPAARTLEDRKAARAELDRLEVEGEAIGIKLAREHERAVEASKAADRAADDARKFADRAKTVRDAHGWGVEIRRSKLQAELARGASALIDQASAEIARLWEAARLAGRYIGAMNAPLTSAQLADNHHADANLGGLRQAIGECELLKLEALSDTDLAAALERIIARIPSRYPQQREAVAIELPRAPNGAGRPRAAQSAKAVA